MVVWFREKDVTLALGITGGAVFSAGAACALYVWLFVQRATSWHTSLILAGVFELIVMAATMVTFRVPEGARSLGGARFDRAALGATLASRDLWVYGLALFGTYGAYFATSQLFSEYATLDRHFDSSAGGLLSALIALAGIPGSLLGGYYADRSRNLRAFIVGPLIVVAALLVLIPVVPAGALWVLGIGIGFFVIFGFAAWLAVPARVCDIEHQYIGTAAGLMLTLAAVGGFFVPIIFGHLVARTSFDVGWVFLAVASFAFALLGLAGHNPATTAGYPGAGTPDPANDGATLTRARTGRGPGDAASALLAVIWVLRGHLLLSGHFLICFAPFVQPKNGSVALYGVWLRWVTGAS